MDAIRKAKIIWQCRRGMLELDLLLNKFIDKKIATLDEKQLIAFERLLGTSDPELYSWLMDTEKPHDKEMLAIVKLIQMQYNA